MSGTFPVDISLAVSSGSTTAGAWVPTKGATRFVLQAQTTAGTSATIKLQGTNFLDGGGEAITPKDIASLSITATGTSTSSSTVEGPFKYVRLNPTANTDTTFTAYAVGVRGA